MMKPLPDRIYKFGWPHFRSWSAKKHLATHYGPTVFGPDSVSYQKGSFSSNSPLITGNNSWELEYRGQALDENHVSNGQGEFSIIFPKYD